MKYRWHILALLVTLPIAYALLASPREAEQLDSLGAAALTRELKPNEINNIRTKMDSLKVTYGQYAQISLDGRILISDGEIVDQQLKDLLPANMTVTVYGGPYGDGFELIQTLSDRVVHYGFGGEAQARTYTDLIPQSVASTTP